MSEQKINEREKENIDRNFIANKRNQMYINLIKHNCTNSIKVYGFLQQNKQHWMNKKVLIKLALVFNVQEKWMPTEGQVFKERFFLGLIQQWQYCWCTKFNCLKDP